MAVAKNSIILIMTWLTFVVVETYRKINKDRTQVWKFLLPILRPLSVVGFAVFGLPGDGIQIAPGLPFGQVHLALFLFGKLLVGNEFLHADFLLL